MTEDIDSKDFYLYNVPENLRDKYFKIYKKRTDEYLKTLPDDIIEINISCKYLKTLPNLRRFKKLKILICSRNALTYLSIGNNKSPFPDSLEELYCNNNDLYGIPDNLPKSLKILDCYYNHLEYLPDKLPLLLEHLDCSDNSIRAFGENLFKNLTKLKLLRFNENKLYKIPEILPKSLTTIWCYGNQFTYIPDSIPETLIYLYCYGNDILKENYPLLGFSDSYGYDENDINNIDAYLPVLTQNPREYIFQRNREINLEMNKENAEIRMQILNENGILIKTASEWMMKPEKIEKYLSEGYSIDDIYDCM